MSELFGLVLAGGRSRRMGRDKAALDLDGQSALARAVALLEPRCTQVYVSVREQDDDPTRAPFQQIPDQFGGIGPADGIASAMRRAPDQAWLVIACDLPRLDARTLDVLIERRDATADATAYASSHDGLPEPLCAIYEPGIQSAIEAQLADDRRCPRKMLLQANTCLLPAAADDALANANTPADWTDITGAPA